VVLGKERGEGRGERGGEERGEEREKGEGRGERGEGRGEFPNQKNIRKRNRINKIRLSGKKSLKMQGSQFYRALPLQLPISGGHVGRKFLEIKF
jgi:hypothetical protein